MFVSDFFFMTLHINRSILILFTSSLPSYLFTSARVCTIHKCWTYPELFCVSSPLASRASFCHTTRRCISSNFPMLHSPYVLSPYPYLRSSPVSPDSWSCSHFSILSPLFLQLFVSLQGWRWLEGRWLVMATWEHSLRRWRKGASLTLSDTYTLVSATRHSFAETIYEKWLIGTTV